MKVVPEFWRVLLLWGTAVLEKKLFSDKLPAQERFLLCCRYAKGAFVFRFWLVLLALK